MSTFFLCHNPLSVPAEGRAGYIYHYSKPRFFAHLLTIDLTRSDLKHIHYSGANIMFLYIRGDGLQQLFALMVDQNIDRATTKLPAALKQAMQWYTTVLNKEDTIKYGKPSQVGLFSDLNLLTPGLQIVHLEKLGKFIVSYPDGIKTFDDSRSMDDFTHSTLGYAHLQLQDGYFNSI